MFEWFKKWLFLLFLKIVYKRYKNKYFPIYSHAPKYMNFAYPDFSVKYYIMTLDRDFTISGTIPMDLLRYFSINLYNTKGQSIYNKNDYYFLKKSKILKKDETISYREEIKIDELTCLIIRFYVKEEFEKENFYKYLPKIESETAISKVKSLERKHNSLELAGLITNAITKKNKNIVPKKFNKFYSPQLSKLDSLFPNKDAKYLIAFPTDITRPIKIIVPKPKYSYKSLRYVSVMTCNFLNTSTDDCFHIMNKKTEVWLLPYNFKEKKENAIYWKKDNQYPIIIYRVVNIENQKLQIPKIS
jgi:hypothetical protein